MVEQKSLVNMFCKDNDFIKLFHCAIMLIYNEFRGELYVLIKRWENPDNGRQNL